MFGSHNLGEILFECIEIRTGGRDPIGLEGFQDEFNFRTPHIWRR